MASDAVIGAIAGVLGAGAGATATGFTTALTGRTDRRNKWLEFKRGNSRGLLQHIAVHRRPGALTEADERLIGHYYVMALAVRSDKAAKALYEALPEDIRARVHDPSAPPLLELRDEVTPSRLAAREGLPPS
jgi:hypothetical protein